MAIRKEGGDESEDDDDIVIGVGENFRKHIDALKRACVLEVGHGGYISTPASILSGDTVTACAEDDDEEEDDDELFLSIKSKYGSFGYGDSPWLGKRTSEEKKLDTIAGEAEDEEEEDDEEILRSVEQLYRSEAGSGQLKLLPKPASPPIDSNGTNDAPTGDRETHPIPSPHGSPGWEPGENGAGEDGGFSPQRRSETSVEPTEDVGRAIVSFLPGNWIETDGHVEHVDPSPTGPLEMLSIEHWDNNLSAAPEETKTYSQPEVANILTDALKKNRQCQRTLRNMLSQVEAKQKENAELQKRVRSLVDFEKYCNRRFAGFFTDQSNPSIKLIAVKSPASQIKSSDPSNKTDSDVQTCGPPENPDVEIYKKLQKKISFTFPTRRWSNEERLALAKGVKQQVYEVLVLQAMDALSNADALDDEFNSLDDHMSKIGGKEFTPQQIRDAVPGIDWAEVARLYVVGRTPEECRTRWINHEDPLINKQPWKKVEDKKLLSIAQQHNFCTWETIAEQLGNNRIPAECLIRYQRSLNASIMRSNWTPEEDNRLRAAVEEWGENDWGAVAACLQGRNNSQCLMRWYKVLHPTKKKRGRWSVEEDKRLKWAVSVYGPKKWKQIAEHVPGRTDLQCRERWCNVLDPSIKLGEWTEEEDRMLEESVARHGPHRWAAVANDLKIRTDNQCCRRWKFRHPEDQPEFQRTVHIRRTALVGNFQGRKKERPRLGPQDFISKDTDFEAFAKKPASKRIAKGTQRKESTEKTGGGKPAGKRIAKDTQRKESTEKSGGGKPAGKRIMKDTQRKESTEKSGGGKPAGKRIVKDTQRKESTEKIGGGKPAGKRIMKDTQRKESTEKSGGGNPAGKRIVKDIQRKESAEKSRDGNTTPSMAVDGPKERRAARILKRRLARARKASDGGAQVSLSAPDVPVEIDLMEIIGPNNSSSTTRADAVNTELANLDRSGERMKQKARQMSNKRRNAKASDIADPVADPSNRSAKGTKRKAGQIADHAEPRKRKKRKFSRLNESLTVSHSQDSSEEVQLVGPGSQGKTHSGSRGSLDFVSQGMTEFGSQGKADSGFQGRADFGSEGRTYLGSRGRTVLGSQRTTALAAPEMVDLAPQGITDLGFHEFTGLGSQGRIDLGSQQSTRSGSQGGTDLGPKGRPDLSTHLDSQGETYLGCQGREDLSIQVGTEVGSEGMTDLGFPSVTEFGSQRTTHLGSQVSSQDAVKIGTTKGDTGSITSPTAQKRRRKPTVRMGDYYTDI